MPKILICTPNYVKVLDSFVSWMFTENYAYWKCKFGYDNVHWEVRSRQFVHFARNAMADKAMEQGYDYVFFVDDDAVIPNTILERFIAHDKDVMIAPYYMRRPPYFCGVLRCVSGNLDTVADYKNLRQEELDKGGLIEVDGGGTHCMLVKTDVFRKVKESSVRDDQQLFCLPPMGGTEDMYFCLRARKLGFKIYVDADVEVGHVGDPQVITSVHHKLWMKRYGDKQPEDVMTPEEVRRGYISIGAETAADVGPVNGSGKTDDAPAGQSTSHHQES